MYPSPTAIRGDDALSRRKRCDAAAGACWRSAWTLPPRGARRVERGAWCVERDAAREVSPQHERKFSHRTAEPDSTSRLNGPIRTDAVNAAGVLYATISNRNTSSFACSAPSKSRHRWRCRRGIRLCLRRAPRRRHGWLQRDFEPCVGDLFYALTKRFKRQIGARGASTPRDRLVRDACADVRVSKRRFR